MKKGMRGFTLIEMAIVLVIIGIILAGVMKGRDIIRGSQVKQFSQGFAQKWQTIASTYYDKTGQMFADGGDNGGKAGDSPNGLMDGVFMFHRGAALKGDALDALRNVGITPCSMIKSDLENDTGGVTCTNGYNIWQRSVEGEFSGRTTVSVGFFSVIIGDGGPIRNCVAYVNVPIDVAKGLDTLIDGQANGEIGSCISGYNQDTTVITTAAASSGAPPGWWGTEPVSLSDAEIEDWGDANGGEMATVLLVLDY